MTPLIVIALVILGFSAAAMTRRNLIHAALLLVAAWAGIAGFYLWAGAEFVAFAQVLVYVGAVSMVVLFAVLLTRQAPVATPAPVDMRRLGWSIVVAGAVAGVLIGAILSSPLPASSELPASINVRQLGAQLMGPHAASLLILGAVLTVALLGAVVIAATGRDQSPEDRR